MESKDFKRMFGRVAEDNGFKFIFGGWYIESSECILVLDLQKSNYGNYYELNIKIHIQECLDQTFTLSKKLIKGNMALADRGQPKEYDDFFNLEVPISDEQRRQGFERFFNEFMVPFSFKALNRGGIKELGEAKLIFLTNSVKKSLEALLALSSGSSNGTQ